MWYQEFEATTGIGLNIPSNIAPLIIGFEIFVTVHDGIPFFRYSPKNYPNKFSLLSCAVFAKFF